MVISNSKPPLGAALAAGVKALSADQHLHFSLYRRYVFPLDGMNYWVRVLPSNTTVKTAGTETMLGLASAIAKDAEAIQISPGSVGSKKIIGGTITNPLTAADQGIATAESLFVDFTGPAYSYATASTVELEPGESIDIPANCVTGAWACAKHGGHKFTVVLQKQMGSVTLPTDVEVAGS